MAAVTPEATARDYEQERRWRLPLESALNRGTFRTLKVASTLEGLVGRKRKIDLGVAADLSKRSIRLPQGAVQDAVLEVLRAAAGSLRVAEIHGRVEKGLGRVVSRDTVTSFLSVACRADAAVVLRVEPGFYEVAR